MNFDVQTLTWDGEEHSVKKYGWKEMDSLDGSWGHPWAPRWPYVLATNTGLVTDLHKL